MSSLHPSTPTGSLLENQNLCNSRRDHHTQPSPLFPHEWSTKLEKKLLSRSVCKTKRRCCQSPLTNSERCGRNVSTCQLQKSSSFLQLPVRSKGSKSSSQYLKMKSSAAVDTKVSLFVSLLGCRKHNHFNPPNKSFLKIGNPWNLTDRVEAPPIDRSTRSTKAKFKACARPC